MEPEVYKFRLKKYYETILKDLEPRKVVGFLYQDDILDEDDMDEVRSERTRKKQAERLLSMLSRKGLDGYPILVNALEETQPHLARLMKTPVPNENLIKPNKQTGTKQLEQQHERDMNELAEKVHCIIGNEPVEQNEQILQHIGNMTEGGLPFISATDVGTNNFAIAPTRFDLISPLYRPHLVDSVYKMTSSPRGLAVIINIMNFDPDPSKFCTHGKKEKLDQREGSEVDEHGLEQLFRGLDCEVVSLKDKKEDELKRELKAISTRDLSSYDCFVMCIMSHGKDGFFYSYDGGKIQYSEIKKMFDNAHCSTLCQKPKLFFIQACRGKMQDTGRTVSDAPSENSERKGGNQVDTPAFIIKEKKTGPSISENSDILLAYSSVEGYPSYRNTARGSRFIKFLVNVFKDYAAMEDVESMLTRVIKEVNKAGVIGDKQVPKPETTLTKKVFFWPGIRDFHL